MTAKIVRCAAQLLQYKLDKPVGGSGIPSSRNIGWPGSPPESSTATRTVPGALPTTAPRDDDPNGGGRSIVGSVGATSSWAQFTLLAEDRDGLRDHLKDRDIPTAVYYPKPNHLQGPYLEAPRAPKGLPVTEHLQQRVVSLPMHPYLSEELQDRIVSSIKSAMVPVA